MFENLKNRIVAALYSVAALLGRFFRSAWAACRDATKTFSQPAVLRLSVSATSARWTTRSWTPQCRVHRRERSSSADDDEAHLLTA